LRRGLRGNRARARAAAALGAEDSVRAHTQPGQSLWVLAAAWVGRGAADDLVQETARVAWQRRVAFTVGTDLRNWLFQIARHLGANWRRRPRLEVRDPEDLPRGEALASLAVGWPFDADRYGLSDGLSNALGALPEVARACLLLHVVIGHSFAEIAVMLDIPENTAMSHARRARLRLRDALTAQACQPVRGVKAPGSVTP
jgi:RNA polymerase sigma-70 factor (ECF subfamily)